MYYNFILDETGDFYSQKTYLKRAVAGDYLKNEPKFELPAMCRKIDKKLV